MLCPMELVVSTHAIAKAPTTERSNYPTSSFMFLSHFNLQLHFGWSSLVSSHFPSPFPDGYIYLWPSCYLPDLLFYCQISLLSFFFCKMVLAEQCCGAAAFLFCLSVQFCSCFFTGRAAWLPFWFNIWIHTVIRGKYIGFLFTILYVHVKRRIQ